MSVNNNQLSDIDNIGEMKINGSYFKQIIIKSIDMGRHIE